LRKGTSITVCLVFNQNSVRPDMLWVDDPLEHAIDAHDFLIVIVCKYSLWTTNGLRVHTALECKQKCVTIDYSGNFAL